jgi:hypothetical protein
MAMTAEFVEELEVKVGGERGSNTFAQVIDL